MNRQRICLSCRHDECASSDEACAERCERAVWYALVDGRGTPAGSAAEWQRGSIDDERPELFAQSWFGPAPVRTPHRGPSAHDEPVERRLLDAIYAAPDELDARVVYGDWLQERGDPRGELIALQCDRAQRGDDVPAEAERALIDAHWRTWIGAAAEIVAPGGIAFDRGLWSACEVFDVGRLDMLAARPEVLDAPAWSIVRRVAIPGEIVDFAPRLLAGPLARGLRSLRLAGRDLLALLTGDDGPVLRIRELELDDRSREAPALPPLPRLPGLAHLIVDCPTAYATRWIAAGEAAGVRAVTLRLALDTPHDKKALRRAKRGRLERFTLEMSTIAMRMHATRDAAGVMAIRTFEIHPSWRVLPDVEVAMPIIEPQALAIAETLRLRLVPLRPRPSAGVYVAVPGAGQAG